MPTKWAIRIVLLGVLGILAAPRVGAGENDWPAYGHDVRGSNATGMPLELPLTVAWEYQPAHEPQPAWPGPALNDFWHNKHQLKPRVTYDRAFHVAVAEGRVYFGSSADDRIVCLDTASGDVLWSFFTEGPVRLAPAVVGGSVYFGSDDGCVYCLSADSGELRWRQRVGPDERRCLGNGRMISRWPVRTGVVVADGVAYAAAGLFPTSEGAYLCGFDAETGETVYRRNVEQPCQGYMLLAGEQLVVPSGRTAPGLYATQDGTFTGTINSPGGSYAVVAGDVVVAGVGDGTGQLAMSDAATRQTLFNFAGRRFIARDGQYYIHSQSQLAAVDGEELLALARQRSHVQEELDKLKRNPDAGAGMSRPELQKRLSDLSKEIDDCWLWRQPCDESLAMILCGEKLVTGGDGRVSAFEGKNGKRVWSGDVDGRAYGLAAAGGCLFVSTDSGQITCFCPASSALSQAGATGAAEDAFAGGKGPDDSAHAEAAQAVLKLSGADQGYCLVLDAGDGKLACEIAEHSRLRVIGVERDAEQVAEARAYLERRGVYGDRVVIHHLQGDRLPYPDYFANLIVPRLAVAAGMLPEMPREVYRVLRPAGGVLCLNHVDGADATPVETWLAEQSWSETTAERRDEAKSWTAVRRQRLTGGGEWTHGLADPGNTACSADQYVKGDLQIQWFGRPGPRPMTDRHHRNVAPLAKNGRLFIPGDNQLIAVDAYNGTELWRREFPKSRRLGAFLDCSNMAVNEGALYFVEHERCHEIDLASGATRRTMTVPSDAEQPRANWGYLALADGLLIGTGTRPDATYQEQSRQADLALWYDNMALVTGQKLFALDAQSGETRWSYESGILVHTTLTLGGGRVYFVESHSPKALSNPLGRVPVADFQDGPNYLVSLEIETGEPVWKHPVDLSDCRHIMYLNYAQEKLLLSGNRYVEKRLWYFFTAMDAATGAEVWKRSHSAEYRPGGDHGEQNRHPTIVGDTVYTYPLAYKLHTGQPVPDWRFNRMGHGCGNIAASAHGIFWRGSNPWRMDLAPGSEPQRINSVTRLGCWINTIPAGGLLLVPEASSGCTCAFPLQTSLAYAPKSEE